MLNLKKRIQRLEVTKLPSAFWFIHLITATQAEFRGYKVCWPDTQEVYIGPNKHDAKQQIESIGKVRGLSMVVISEI